MRRAALLVTLALVASAGCLGAVSGPSSSTPTSTPYPNETVPFPDGPKERPELPEQLTPGSAGDYARLHEFRYSYNDLWEGPETEVGLSADNSCSVESTEERGSGYLVVVVECVGYVNQPAEGNTTRTIHYDLAPWTVRYYIDRNSVVREEIESE